MKIAPLELRKPTTIDGVLDALSSLGSDAQILAGGQSLIPLMRYRMATPFALIDINQVKDLDKIHFEKGVRLGALVRHAQLEKGDYPVPDQFKKLAALLRAHASEIAFWPVRTRGTVVGSLVNADPKSDWLLLMFALNANINLKSRRNERVMAVRDFVVGPLQTQRQVDEFASHIDISEESSQVLNWGRHKVMLRAGDFALSSAVVLQYETGWQCWLSANNSLPVALTKTASWLDSSATVGKEQTREFLDLVRSELNSIFNNEMIEHADLHAATLLDAVADASRNK